MTRHSPTQPLKRPLLATYSLYSAAFNIFAVVPNDNNGIVQARLKDPDEKVDQADELVKTAVAFQDGILIDQA